MITDYVDGACLLKNHRIACDPSGDHNEPWFFRREGGGARFEGGVAGDDDGVFFPAKRAHVSNSHMGTTGWYISRTTARFPLTKTH